MFERSKSKFNSSAMTDSSAARSSSPDRERARFLALWGRCLAGVPRLADSAYERLCEFYEEPHRRYHTLNHIRHCLSEFDQAAILMDDPDAVEMALWFHDVIYLPGAKDNELRSAELFREWSAAWTDSAFQKRVYDLIMVTTHRGRLYQRNEQFIADIDLSSFGLPWEAFERDGRLIRAECAEIADSEYYPGHLHFLLTLQARPTFFFTDFFQQRYEQVARENIRRIIVELRARGYG